MVRLQTFLEQWKIARADAAQAVEDMPAGKLDFKPQDDLMSFREVAIHILGVGYALAGVMLDGESDLSTPDFREKLKKYARPAPDGQAELAAALRSAVVEHCDSLAARPPEFFAEFVTKWDG